MPDLTARSGIRHSRRTLRGRGLAATGLGIVLALGALGCGGEVTSTSRPRLLVVGVDGADPEVIRQLAAAGDLPHLASLIDKGSFVPLESDFKSASPVVWTTMVTGVGPDEHGIRDFFVADGKGSFPVMSGARLRPALWNMLDRVGRHGAFLGLWATWPAEKTSGVILSDRAVYEQLDDKIYPPERAEALASWRERAKAPDNPFPREGVAQQDQVVNLAAREAVADDTYDLVFAYFESVDVVSHHFWHLFQPKPFRRRAKTLPRSESADPVRDAYKAIDAVVGDLLQHAPKGINTIVVSDHGFKADPKASNQVTLGFDLILAELGFLRWQADGSVDPARSSAWTFDSSTYAVTKHIQTRPGLPKRERDALVGQLRSALSTCSFEGGGAAFRMHEPGAAARADNVILDAEVMTWNASSQLDCRGRLVPKAVRFFGGPATGRHDSNTAGTLIVHGPLFARGASQPGVSVRDIAPTILYALGLPVGRDFIGEPALDLFTPEFRRAHPVRRIESWGKREPQQLFASSADEKLIEKLVALGYLQ